MRDFRPYSDKVERELSHPVLQSCAARHVDGSFFGQEGVLCAVRGGLVFVSTQQQQPGELLKIPTQKVHSIELADQIGGCTLLLETERGALSFSELARERCTELLLGAGFEPQRVGRLLQADAQALTSLPSTLDQANVLPNAQPSDSSEGSWHGSVTSTPWQTVLPPALSGDIKPPWRAAMSAPLPPAPWASQNEPMSMVPDLSVPVLGEVALPAEPPPAEVLFDDVTPVDPALLQPRPETRKPTHAGPGKARVSSPGATQLQHKSGQDAVRQLLRELTPHSQVRVRSTTGAEVVLRGSKLRRLLAHGRLGPDTLLAVIGGDESFVRLGDTPLLTRQRPRVLGTSARVVNVAIHDDEITGELLLPDPPDTLRGIKRGYVVSVVLMGLGAAMGAGAAGLIGLITGAVGGLILGAILGALINRLSAD